MRFIQYLPVVLLLVGGIFIGLFFYKKWAATPNNSSPPIQSASLKDSRETHGETETEAALKLIERVDPSEIKDFPAELNFMMKREGCKIPRIPGSKNTGWIQGSFTDPKQKDYAALCITPQNEMTIKVQWGGKLRPCSISLAYGQATNYVVFSKKSELMFSRVLLLAPKNRMAYFAKQVAPSFIKKSLDGIEDALQDKRSVIYYCEDNGWKSIETNYPN